MRNGTIPPCFLLLLAPEAAPQGLVTGQVVDPLGAGVAAVDLDFFRASNGDEETNLQNDGTGAGGFFSTSAPPETYNVLFLPPFSTSLQPKWVNGVTVVQGQTTALGVVPLLAGFQLTATFLRPGIGTPVVGASVQVRDAATGAEVPQAVGSTNAFGQMTAVVPAGVYDVRLNPTGLAGPLLAPWQSLGVAVSANTSLGSITLSPGFTLSATVLGSTGLPVSGVDVDVAPVAGGSDLYTPGDNTDSFGFVDVVVPAGIYEVEFAAPLAARLVSALLAPVSVSATTSLGTVPMSAGFYLSGTVTAVPGGPLAGVDIDVRDAASGAPVPTSNDDTGGAGTYIVVVPAGTWDVEFTPFGAPGYQGVLATGISVSADATLDASLPTTACAPSPYGAPTPGSGGLSPALAANNPAFPGNPWFAVEIAGGLGGMPGLLLLGAGGAAIPIFGGTLLVDPVPFLVQVPFVLSGPAGTPGVGEVVFPFPIPSTSSLVGGTAFLQAVNLDALAPQGIAFSNGLAVPVCL
ncbi:MAG: carboxypeptidase-like regulatory domain-containing protein [Planctomycetes bacterium]|nr:carboxypeptidase-like regulatory domain-containing protein [Planctomycetota bacterium]